MANTYVVYKTAALPMGVQEIEFHQDFELLHAEYQHGKLAFWYRCLADAPVQKRTVAFIVTGAPCPSPDEADHIGSFLLHQGTFVLHAFIQKL